MSEVGVNQVVPEREWLDANLEVLRLAGRAGVDIASVNFGVLMGVAEYDDTHAPTSNDQQSEQRTAATTATLIGRAEAAAAKNGHSEWEFAAGALLGHRYRQLLVEGGAKS